MRFLPEYMSVAIKLTIPKPLAKQTQDNVKHFGYSNLQELTLDALRQKNRELDTLRWLEKTRNSLDIKELTADEREQLAKTFTPQTSSEILRKFQLN